MNLSPERVIVSGDKSTLIMRPVFGEYYILWGWYKTFRLLSIDHNTDFGRCGIVFRVLFFLFGIPLLGELFCILIFLLLGGFS